MSNKVKPIDTNIEHYSVSDMMIILDIADPSHKAEIEANADTYINQFTDENRPDMVLFFQNMKEALLEYADELETSDEPVELASQQNQTNNWQNIHLDQSDANQVSKITDRVQKVGTFNDQHLSMKREQLGVANTASVPVVQDSLNPILKNTITRMINIDSQFRQTSAGNNNMSTDFVLDLSEPLLNVLSLKLHAFAIPYTWYTLDVAYNNNCFWISFVDDNNAIITSVNISIEPGNYTPQTFQAELTNSFINSGLEFSTATPIANSPIIVNVANGKATLNLYGGTYTDTESRRIYIIDDTSIITFFDPTNTLRCSNNSCLNTISVNQTLGWIMGFRLLNINVDPLGNKAIAILDLYGPRYLILVIDDFNQNHINNGLICIAENSTHVKLPSYYSPDMLYTCTRANTVGTNMTANSQYLVNDINAGNLLVEKSNISYRSIPQLLPSAPRTLTQTQIYTINEIIKNNDKPFNYKAQAPFISNTFAIIPIKHGNFKTGDVYVESNGSLQDNKRTYFGPVNIDRMRVKLLDDKGNLLNLNGCDWCITLVSENLYQF